MPFYRTERNASEEIAGGPLYTQTELPRPFRALPTSIKNDETSSRAVRQTDPTTLTDVPETGGMHYFARLRRAPVHTRGGDLTGT